MANIKYGQHWNRQTTKGQLFVFMLHSSPPSFNEDQTERQRKSKFKHIPNVYQCKNVKPSKL